MSRWGDLDFSVSPTANSSTDWPDAASDKVLTLGYDGSVTKPQNPAFAAHSGSTYYTHGSSTGTLNVTTLTNELYDVGGVYDASTNVFTAPVAGKYFMSFMFAYRCTSGYLNVKLSKGVSGTYSLYGRMMSSPPQQSSEYSDAQGIVGVMDLAAGNTVRPQVEVNYSGNRLVNCMWSCYLLG